MGRPRRRVRGTDRTGNPRREYVARYSDISQHTLCHDRCVEERYRPVALRVMAEYMDEDPVWDSDIDHLGPVVLEELGVTEGLAQDLRAWNEGFKGTASTGFRFGSVDEERRWEQEGLRLAYELQNELPDIEISYAHEMGGRTVRERRGAPDRAEQRDGLAGAARRRGWYDAVGHGTAGTSSPLASGRSGPMPPERGLPLA